MTVISGDAARHRFTAASVVLLVAAMPFALFCWWGLYTAAGRKSYDEMDAFIPFFGGVGAALAVLLALALYLFGSWRSRRRG